MEMLVTVSVKGCFMHEYYNLLAVLLTELR